MSTCGTRPRGPLCDAKTWRNAFCLPNMVQRLGFLDRCQSLESVLHSSSLPPKARCRPAPPSRTRTAPPRRFCAVGTAQSICGDANQPSPRLRARHNLRLARKPPACVLVRPLRAPHAPNSTNHVRSRVCPSRKQQEHADFREDPHWCAPHAHNASLSQRPASTLIKPRPLLGPREHAALSARLRNPSQRLTILPPATLRVLQARPSLLRLSRLTRLTTSRPRSRTRRASRPTSSA